LSPFFGNSENVIDFVIVDKLPQYSDLSGEAWNDIFNNISDDSELSYRALFDKNDSQTLPVEAILVDQLKSKPGGQLVEVKCSIASIVLCELPTE
jgi:hypothetical protein